MKKQLKRLLPVLQLARGFSLNATLENIADKRYRTSSCGISAPGRNVTTSLMYRF